MKSIVKLGLPLLMLAMSAMTAVAVPVQVQGTVSSGGAPQTQAIAGATVTIYQAQPGGAQALATGTSDNNGAFTVTADINGSGDVLYAVARKGTNIELMTIIGTTVPVSITINEMTTVATAYAMAQVFHNGAIPYKPLVLKIAAGMAENLVSATTGTPSTIMQTAPNANQTNAWRSLGTLANILAVCVRNSGHACTQLFELTNVPRASPPTTLTAMVNIARNPAKNLRTLFTLGEYVKVYVPNLDAANSGPDAADKFMRLDAFTLAIKFNATGRVDGNGVELCPFAGLGNIAFDASGYAWITNNVVQGTPDSTNCLVVLKPNGQPADGTNGTPNSPIFGGGLLGQGFGIGFDPSGRNWSGNFGWGSCAGCDPVDVNGNPGGSVTLLSPSGQPLSPPYGYTSNIYRAQGTVSDSKGNIWIAGWGNNTVQIFPNGDPNSSYPVYQDTNTEPFDIRLDSDGSGWVSYTLSSFVSKFTRTDNGLVRQFTVPIGTNAEVKGVAVDSKGNGWVAAGGNNAVYAVDKNGNLLGKFAGGGIAQPWGVTVDSNDIVWVANFGPTNAPQATLKYNVTKLCGATVSNCPPGAKLGDPITSDTGYTLPSAGDEVLLHSGVPLMSPLPIKSYKPLMRLTSVEVDMAGNLWAANNWKPGELNDLLLNPGGDGAVIFVGLAAPVIPVLYSAPATSPFALPIVGSMSPRSGPAAGDTTVTITGANFTGTTAVTFGGIAATNLSINSATSITVKSPAHADGPVDVVVTSRAGIGIVTGTFTYGAVLPSVASVSPSSGPTEGSTTVIITGTNFTGVTAVTFGNTPAIAVTVNSPTSITAMTQAHDPGAVDVAVTTAIDTAAAYTAYTFVPTQAASFTGISPASGPMAGGTNVTITGTNFTGASAVTFGGSAATAVAVVNATTMTATTPAHAAGAVNVAVTTPGGTANGTNVFTYLPSPVAAGPTYVSARNGNDSGQCPVTAPCATLNYALSVASAGGVITVLDAGVFGPVVLTGSITIAGNEPEVLAQIVANPGAQVGCIGALPAACGLTNNGYAVEIAAGASDVITINKVLMSAGASGSGAFKLTSGGAAQLSNTVFRGNGSSASPIVSIAPGQSSVLTQVYMSNGDIAFSKNGGAVLVAPTGTNAAKLHFNHMEVHNAAFGIKTDATGLNNGTGISTFVSESEFFSFSGSAVTALSAASAGTGGAVNSVYNQVNILNSGGPAINANGAQTSVILTGNTAAGNFQGIKLSNGASVITSVNNTIKGNGADVIGSMTNAPLQ